MKLLGGPVAWRMNKQDTITTSSIKTELLTFLQTIKEAIYMARLFRVLKVELDKSLTIECDNLMIIRLLVEETARLQTKFRYVDIHFYWFRQEI